MTKQKKEKVYTSLEALREEREAEAKAKTDKARELEQAQAKAEFQKAFNTALGDAEDMVVAKMDEIGFEDSISEADKALKEREGYITQKAHVDVLERIKGKVLGELATRPGRYQDAVKEIKTLRDKANSNYVSNGAKIYQAPPSGKIMKRIVELEKQKRQLEAAALSSVQGKIDTILNDGGNTALAFVAGEDKEWKNWKAEQAKRSK